VVVAPPDVVVVVTVGTVVVVSDVDDVAAMSGERVQALTRSTAPNRTFVLTLMRL
jgi:hypothetical protein